jgi:hypothetical protein
LSPPLRDRLSGLRARLREEAPSDGGPAGANDSARVIGDDRLWELHERYRASFAVPALSYGTARDLADSTDNLGGLARYSSDMKDLQRCWLLKAILGKVAPDTRLVEIGAGEPLVAGLLSRLGYEVTVVDPYDGSGNGPREYELFRRLYPDLDFVRDQFGTATRLDGRFDCVYSISVLEHVPIDAIDDVMLAAQQLTGGSKGASIHAIDHVVSGWGAEEHLQRLQRIVEGSALPPADLEATLAELEKDPNAYFVSAEAHDRWRGSLDYDAYPMRRIASIQLFKS